MGASLDAVQAVYDNYQQKLGMMLAACRSDQIEEHDEIVQKYQDAKANLEACILKVFQEDDSALQAVVVEETASAAKIAAIEAELGNIAKVVGVVTQAVSYGAAIVAMGAAI